MTDNNQHKSDSLSHRNKHKLIWIIITICTITTLSCYFAFFNTYFSNNQQDWAAFGSYFSGIMMPILTSINIWVFIQLTSFIHKEDKSSAEKELAFQRKTLNINILTAEINYFNNIYSKIGLGGNDIERLNTIASIESYLTTFKESKGLLFQKCNEQIYDNIDDLCTRLIEIRTTAKNNSTNTQSANELKQKIEAQLWEYVLNIIDSEE